MGRRFNAAVLALCAGGALAHERGAYIGISAGASSTTDACGMFVARTGCNDGAATVKFFVGSQVSRGFGFELGYSPNLGRAESTAGGQTLKFDARAWEFVIIPAVSLGDHASLLLKAGPYLATSAIHSSVPGSGSRGGTAFEITYGLGLAYHFNRNVTARVEWQRYPQVGDLGVGPNQIGQSDIDVAGVGLLYRF